MELVLLNEKNKEQLQNKKIVCFEKSVAYLTEFESEYPDLFKNIAFIVDSYQRNIGEQEIMGRLLNTYTLDGLDMVDEAYAIIITSDYYKEAYAALNEYFAGKTYIPSAVYYYPNKETRIDLAYREKYEKQPLEDLILFRSGPHPSGYVYGTDYADNARALFEYMLSVGLNKKYQLVWYVKKPEEFSYITNKYENVEFVSFDWSAVEDESRLDAYYEPLCLAKYIFMTDAYGFCRNAREDQIRIQLWHGCGFKTRTNFVPCEKRYEYNTVIGERYKEIHADIYGLRDDQVVITGHPKTDWLYHPVEEQILRDLGIKKASKYIFWLPTFRRAKSNLSILNEKAFDNTETGLPVVYEMNQLLKINNLLREKDTVMIIKLHPFQKAEDIRCDEMSNIALLNNDAIYNAGIQINQLLGWSDALISDYSSVAIEYISLDKPLGFTLDDVEEYEGSRGFVFDNIKDYLPGQEIWCFDDFYSYVEEITEGIDSTKDKRHAVRDKMYSFVDDNNSKRVIEWMESLEIQD